MKTPVWVFVLLLLAAGLAHAAQADHWRDDAPCGRSVPVKPVEAPGCDQAYAAQLPDGTRFSACLLSDDEEKPSDGGKPGGEKNSSGKGNVRLRLERGGKTFKEWRTDVIPAYFDGPVGRSSGGVRVDRLDLRGDGKQDALIAILHAQTLGLPVESWSVWAFDGVRLSEPLDVENYGTLSFPVCDRARAGAFCSSPIGRPAGNLGVAMVPT